MRENIQRVPTGIPGFDRLINGGFPKPSAILLSGEPGSGKTTFAIQSLFYGAKTGENGLYLTCISEPTWVVQRFIATYRFYNKELVERGKIQFIDLGQNLINDPESILTVIKEYVEKYLPARFVIDPLTPVKNTWQKIGKTREKLHELLAYLKSLSSIIYLTSELSFHELHRNPESYLVDGIVYLSYPEEEKIRRKYIEVLKMRGTKHIMGRQLMDITRDGITVQSGLT